MIKEVKKYLEDSHKDYTEEYAYTLEIMGNYYRFRYEEKQAIEFIKTALCIWINLFGEESE